jgi:hypothetical protein
MEGKGPFMAIFENQVIFLEYQALHGPIFLDCQLLQVVFPFGMLQ